MIIQVALLFAVYLILVILTSYYVNLYLTKDQFTKDELKNVMPYLKESWVKISRTYAMPMLAAIFLVSSIIGIILPMLSQHWFLNSAILFLVMFFTFPLAKKNVHKAGVTTGGDFSDTVMSIFAQYDNIILSGFGGGTATGLMYNWGAYNAVHFLWFLVNFIALSIMVGIVIRNAINR
ncbi:MAG: hypothetical protein QUS13_13080 [Smithella sp.]|nr:hypothetical protein [Smithella sp.]